MRNDGRFSIFLRVSLLSLTLLAGAGTAAAQNNDNRAVDNRNNDRPVAVRENRDDDTDWGWLGLLGLAGLLGLMPKKKHEVHVRETHDRDAGDRR